MKVRWLLLATLPLGGCMTSGTNMHGDFACRAPNGTCAPMSSIDASAIAGMGGAAQPIGGPEIRSVPRGGRVVQASTGSVPARTSDRVLQIVFPAHIDASGIYHDAATAHAVVEPSGWTESLTGRPVSVPIATATAPASLPASASSEGSSLATLDEVIAAKGAQVVATNRPPVPVTVVPVPAAAGMTPASWSRDPSALNLREAAAGADGGTVPGLDGSNFDTPDVTAALDPAPSAASTGSIARYKTVRWHGRKVRVPMKAITTRAAPPAAVSTTVLNLASLQKTSSGVASSGASSAATPDTPLQVSSAAPGYSTQPISGATADGPASPPVAVSSAQATTTTTAPPPPPRGIAATPPMTKSAAIAAARVRAMAAPVIAGGIADGRAQAAAEATPEANPFTALVAAGNGATQEPRP